MSLFAVIQPSIERFVYELVYFPTFCIRRVGRNSRNRFSSSNPNQPIFIKPAVTEKTITGIDRSIGKLIII